jgi:hypothetical protein
VLETDHGATSGDASPGEGGPRESIGTLIACSACREKQKVSDKQIGKRVQCFACGAWFLAAVAGISPPAKPKATDLQRDRNLLLGILAYQNAFITREALFMGMQAWLIKNRKLGAINTPFSARLSDWS